MGDIVLVIPVAGELRKGRGSEGWVAEGDTVFYTIRYFLKCRKRDRPGRPKAGKIEKVLGGAKGVKSTRKETLEIQIVEKDVSNMLQEYFASSEQLASLSAGIALDILKLPVKFNLSSKLSEKAADSFKTSNTITHETSTTVTRKLEVTYEVDSKKDAEYVVPRMYREVCYDVFVAKVDYLIVRYEKAWVRYHRHKYPEAGGASSPKTHRNVHYPQFPLCCISGYELVESSAAIRADNHELEVEYPDDLTTGPPERTDQGVFREPDCPTLYAIAEKAFPPKWDQSLSADAQPAA
jgi:hypothetical protein